MAFDSEITEKSADLLVLERARERERIARGWRQESGVDDHGHACMGGAYALVMGTDVHMFHTRAMSKFARLLGFRGVLDPDRTGERTSDAMVVWNDAPGRTQAEVLARFDAAIAKLGAEG